MPLETILPNRIGVDDRQMSEIGSGATGWTVPNILNSQSMLNALYAEKFMTMVGTSSGAATLPAGLLAFRATMCVTDAALRSTGAQVCLLKELMEIRALLEIMCGVAVDTHLILKRQEAQRDAK